MARPKKYNIDTKQLEKLDKETFGQGGFYFLGPNVNYLMSVYEFFTHATMGERKDERTQFAHIESLNKYLDKDGNPKCMDIVVSGERVKVPLLTLAPHSSIKIKELTMDLKVKLNNFGKRKSRFGGGIFGKEDAGAISAALGSSIFPSKNNYANLKITFEGCDPPEGVVRVNNNLIKQIP